LICIKNIKQGDKVGRGSLFKKKGTQEATIYPCRGWLCLPTRIRMVKALPSQGRGLEGWSVPSAFFEFIKRAGGVGRGSEATPPPPCST